MAVWERSGGEESGLGFGAFQQNFVQQEAYYGAFVNRSQASMPTSTDAELPEDLTFEQAITELETIVARLEDEPPPLDDALDAYERGMLLATYCRKRLDAATLRIQELALE